MKAQDWKERVKWKRKRVTMSRRLEDHCADSNGSDVSDELVSLVTAGASFVKPNVGWYKAERLSAH